jgi:rubredoxin
MEQMERLVWHAQRYGEGSDNGHPKSHENLIQFHHFKFQGNHSMSTPTFKTFVCIVCGFVYDEAEGRPEDGIAAGTTWADVPADWACPECGVAKNDFELVDF